MWDDFHSQSRKDVDITSQMVEIYAQCRQYRAVARQLIAEMNLKVMDERKQKAQRMNEFTY